MLDQTGTGSQQVSLVPGPSVSLMPSPRQSETFRNESLWMPIMTVWLHCRHIAAIWPKLMSPPTSSQRGQCYRRRPKLWRMELFLQYLMIEKLYLGQNCLTENILHLLMIFKELKVLNLSFNEIVDLPTNFFRNVVNLEEISQRECHWKTFQNWKTCRRSFWMRTSCRPCHRSLEKFQTWRSWM